MSTVLLCIRSSLNSPDTVTSTWVSMAMMLAVGCMLLSAKYLLVYPFVGPFYIKLINCS